MSEYLERTEKILDRIHALGAISEEQNCVSRSYGTLAFVEGRSLVKKWMEAASLQTAIDHVGNVRAKLYCGIPNAKTFVIGSHIDTVVNAGKFDGPLGVILGIDLLEKLIQSKVKLPFNIELIAFCDEEGVRFQTTFLGSKAIAGSFDKNILDNQDKNGISLREAIQAIGGDANKIEEDIIPAENWLGYFEIHIEQGPVLYTKNIPIALVTAIAGQCRFTITFTGIAGHAGTVPMDMRNDALCCAAEFVLATEKYALENKDSLVATVGKLEVVHGAGNVIPGQVICSLDVRSADEATLSAAVQHIKSTCEAIAANRQISLEWNRILETKSVICDKNLSVLLEESISDKKYELVSLVSGAGHDAVPISEIAPVSMLFVRCFEGISHNPLENAALKDIAAAVEVSEQFLSKLILNQS
jgi:allantoate deiminase